MTDQNGFYIKLKVELDHGNTYVHSDEVPGLHLYGKHFQAMRMRIEAAIKRLYRENEGIAVNVIWLSSKASPRTVDNVTTRLAVYKAAA